MTKLSISISQLDLTTMLKRISAQVKQSGKTPKTSTRVKPKIRKQSK